MEIPYQLIAVFTKNEFRGNISAVISLDQELETVEMQRIAQDFNQPATTFFWTDKNGGYHIRWFAPDAEIPLCGHGLAAATAYFIEKGENEVEFNYSKGVVSGKKHEKGFQIQLQKGTYQKAKAPKELEKALGIKVVEYYKTSDKNIVLVENEEQLKNMRPNFSLLSQFQPFGYGVTAKSKTADFCSRTLVPKVQQLEDHATGSTHSVLVPFWSDRLKKEKLSAVQHSPRGGVFECLSMHDFVALIGDYHIAAEGVVFV